MIPSCSAIHVGPPAGDAHVRRLRRAASTYGALQGTALGGSRPRCPRPENNQDRSVATGTPTTTPAERVVFGVTELSLDVAFGDDGITPPSASRSKNMAAVRRADTKPEIQLRRHLHADGYRFRKDFAIRTGGRLIRPDIAFTRSRVAVFVDGCFWHSCPEHGQTPATNEHFWKPKLAGNVARDRLQDRLLQDAGWAVVRIWEHEPVQDAATAVTDAVRTRQTPT